MEKKLTQKQVVIERLKKYGSIDNFYCFHNYILRLGAIICQLKKEGWEFDSRFGEGNESKNYYYYLVKKGYEKDTQ